MTLTDAALAAELAVDAGKLLLAVRDEVGFAQPWHLGDLGDGRANQLIIRRLRDERPGDAVLSEESPDNLARLRADRVWIVDPLDGTREFTTRGRDDWAVHIALWQRVGGPDGASTLDNALSGKPQIVQIEPTDTAFKTNGCQPWQLTDAPPPNENPPWLSGIQLRHYLDVINGLSGASGNGQLPPS